MPTQTENLLAAIKEAVHGANNPKTVKLIDDTNEHAGPFYALQALTDAAGDFGNCTINIIDEANFTIPKGVTIYGNFTSVALSSGSVLAYTK